MRILLNYQILEVLGESLHSEVFKVQALDNSKDKILVLKQIKPQFNSSGLITYLQQQIEQLTELVLPHTIIPFIDNPNRDSLFLVRKFFDGIPLTGWLKKRTQIDIVSALKVIVSIVQRLEENHQTGHIHKGIKPNNILINPQTFDVQLIDDVRVLDINQISHFIYEESFRLATLPYLSPEQTGRIKYSINYTTDLYALGMILFEALTGNPPFLFNDPIAIIHSHLAETAARVDSINSDIPKILGDIVAILLEKAPESRYQTASGLRVDLLKVLLALQENKNPDFILKKKDFSNRITIPSLMVGRDIEKKQLLNEFSKVCSGVFRAALISGLSGIGKTRLIQELQLPIVSHYGYFCAGKFEQFKKHIPYSTLIQAFTYLIKTLLTEDSERLNYWKQRISESLGENGRLMTDLIPELELIIGAQPEVADLPPVEARNRFNDVAGKFIACFASKEHPLTLFIDDLQWCDGASFDLLERLFDNLLEYPYLFWLGAYRHNEVDDSHRLMRLVKKIKQANNRPLLEIRLQALGLAEVNLMTAYILNTYPQRTEALAEVIYHTSVGNPLFVNESLRWLHTYKHLHLSSEGIWEWDDKELRHTKIPDSALELFKDKISKLSPRVLSLLEIAACLGARFDAVDLALAAGFTVAQLHKALTEAFVQNILLRDKESLAFFHDQVQAATASFMDVDKKRQVHHQIAQAFIANIPDDVELEELPKLFSIVEHLGEGRDENADFESRWQEAKFNYAAGIAAMRGLAMDNANFFFHQALQLFPELNWTKHYSFLFSLHKYLARTEMALGNQITSETILNTLITESRNDLDRVDCLYEQTTGLSSLGNFKRAIELGNQGLRFFQRAIPENDVEALSKAAVIFAQIHKPNRDVWQQILDVEPSSDRATQIETGIYSELIPDYYLAGMVPQLYLAAIQSTQNCLAGGVDESVIYGFSMMGLYLQRKGHYDLSFRYEDLGIALAQRYPDTFGATKGINGILWTNRHNRKNSEAIITECQQNIHRGKTCGDLYNAGLSYGPYIWHLMTQGADLQKITEIANECIVFSQKFNLSLSLGLAESALAGWSSLMQTEARKFTEEEIEQYLQRWENDKHVVSIGGYYTLKGIAHHYLGDYQQAALDLTSAQPYLRGLSDNILNRLWYVFRYTNSLQLGYNAADEQPLLDECLKNVSVWAELGPILKPYLAFMLAVQADYQKNFSEARRYYFDAIDSSRAEKYVLLEAFLQERLAQLLMTHQHEHSNYHLYQALTAYQHCAANVKAQQLIEKYSLVVARQTTENNSEIALAQRLDINYLVEATREITSQLNFEPLLGVIMKAVMERLGARHGYLLIPEQQGLSVFAKGSKRDNVEVEIKDDKILNTDTLSMPISVYVYRTGEIVVLENASATGDFMTDEVVVKKQLKSILCLPLLKQLKTLGVLYLENSLIPAVFNPEQIELTKLLTAQVAIALENTLLITEMKQNQQQIQLFNEQLEQKVAERTAELNMVNEELKNFAYVVSHDLKAPLRAINQLAAWIEEDYGSAFDEDGRSQMSLLRSRARKMHDMIDGILQYSRIGRVKEATEQVDLNSLVHDVIDAISPPAHIKLDIQAGLPSVYGEKLRIYQVIQNLLDNAIKYNNKAEGLISLTCQEQPQDWCFCVQDNGMGIDKPYQQRVFQLFQTLEPKDQHNSTGIGLSLVEKIINLWGGKIWLESEINQGCRFFFTIPKKK